MMNFEEGASVTEQECDRIKKETRRRFKAPVKEALLH